MKATLERLQRMAKSNSMMPEVSQEQIELLSKLHWIGLDDEAERLQRAIPAGKRASVLSWPASTD